MSGVKFLACDFGAESGRVIVGTVGERDVLLEEVHRFPNRPVETAGHYHWDIPSLFGEMKKGMARAVRQGHGDIRSVGIDAWGVDFGLIARNGRLLGLPFTYRDPRTGGEIMDRVFEKISREEVYSLTGIQVMQINSLFQLYSAVVQEREQLDLCDTLLFVPDLFNYLLTGVKCSEYTIASTSQMLNAQAREWDSTIFQRLDLPGRIMPRLVMPGTVIGRVRGDIAEEIGLKNAVEVVAVASHDTASAVAAVPGDPRSRAYVSSGTWSLVGIESPQPLITGESLAHQFTNEGGAGGSILFLRNVAGMWLLQECLKRWSKEGAPCGYGELLDMAGEAPPFACVIDPDDGAFLNPPDMPRAIDAYCAKTCQPAPGTKGEYTRSILESLALKYRTVIKEIESITKAKVDALHIVGGGARNTILNQWSADATGIPVIAGPFEATALGNILVQAIALGILPSLREGRELVSRSIPATLHEPRDTATWEAR